MLQVYYMCAGRFGGKEIGVDPLKLQKVVSHLEMGIENWTWVLSLVVSALNFGVFSLAVQLS